MTAGSPLRVLTLFWICSGFVTTFAAVDALRRPPFAIEVVDAGTGRGVPLVELTTVSGVRFLTDSAGFIAIDDPAFVRREVFFHVKSHGYEFPADGFGFRGAKLNVIPGGTARLQVKRHNVAERLYRVTGEGIYSDSVQLGRKPPPVKEPLLNGEVVGQDSAQQAVYRGKIYWFFGDTNRQQYPLGHFWMSGATSQLPGNGGLDPSVGIDLTYFTGDDGFARGTFERVDNHPVWADGVVVLRDGQGRERLTAKAAVIKSLGEIVGRYLAVWNDERAMFEKVKEIPDRDAPLTPAGHPLRVEEGGRKYVYYGLCLPHVRMRDDWKSWQDFASYEAFTCLAPGGRYEKATTKLDRDASGKLIWAWKRDTAPLEYQELQELAKANLLKPDEAWFRPLDVETKQPVVLGMGSVRWNACRKRYVMIAGQVGGSTSMLGEIWYSEADAPQGPWRWARKIVTHDKYSFYNPVHHDFFDQDGGKTIYFQGTYTGTFSRTGDLTPRYDYNQILYRLNLGDERLKLPL
jgi:hypothetical protein